MNARTDTDALMLLRAIKPDPMYLLLAMYIMKLTPPPNVVAADEETIAAAVSWNVKTLRGHLRQLQTMAYAGRLHHRGWYVTDGGRGRVIEIAAALWRALGFSIHEEVNFTVSGTVSSSKLLNNINDSNLILTTTNYAEEVNFTVSAQQLTLEAPAATPTTPALALDPHTARLATLLHDEHGTQMRYALEGCHNALSTGNGSPLSVELNILLWAEYCIENTKGMRSRAAVVSRYVERGEGPPKWFVEQFRREHSDAYDYGRGTLAFDGLSERQQRIIELEQEMADLAQVIAENTEATSPAALVGLPATLDELTEWQRERGLSDAGHARRDEAENGPQNFDSYPEYPVAATVAEPPPNFEPLYGHRHLSPTLEHAATEGKLREANKAARAERLAEDALDGVDPHQVAQAQRQRAAAEARAAAATRPEPFDAAGWWRAFVTSRIALTKPTPTLPQLTNYCAAKLHIAGDQAKLTHAAPHVVGELRRHDHFITASLAQALGRAIFLAIEETPHV